MTLHQEFTVHLDIYSGPFSVLLDLISKKSLDVTEVALAEVTDDFLAFITAHEGLDLSLLSEFLVVAATLLDMKAARLLPNHKEDEEDWDLIEQRDFLFAKLLQYRAYKEVAEEFHHRMDTAATYIGRDVPLEEQFTKIIPKTRLNLSVEDLALLVVQAYARQETPTVSLAHLHHPIVDVASQITFIEEHLETHKGRTSFRELCTGVTHTAVIVSRFLAILQLLRNKTINISQPEPLGELLILATPEEEQATHDN